MSELLSFTLNGPVLWWQVFAAIALYRAACSGLEQWRRFRFSRDARAFLTVEKAREEGRIP